MSLAPDSIPCPCGEGEAVRCEQTLSEPGDLEPGPVPGEDLPRSVRAINYRHVGADCPLGGLLVVADDEVIRRVGPIFRLPVDARAAPPEALRGPVPTSDKSVAEGREIARGEEVTV